jgi:hypothetical protein
MNPSHPLPRSSYAVRASAGFLAVCGIVLPVRATASLIGEEVFLTYQSGSVVTPPVLMIVGEGIEIFDIQDFIAPPDDFDFLDIQVDVGANTIEIQYINLANVPISSIASGTFLFDGISPQGQLSEISLTSFSDEVAGQLAHSILDADSALLVFNPEVGDRFVISPHSSVGATWTIVGIPEPSAVFLLGVATALFVGWRRGEGGR